MQEKHRFFIRKTKKRRGYFATTPVVIVVVVVKSLYRNIGVDVLAACERIEAQVGKSN